MEDDPREMLIAALDRHAYGDEYFDSGQVAARMADVALAALAEAGYRLMREDDLRWLVDNLNWAALGDPYSQAGDDLPTGVRVLLDEMEGE